LKTILWDWNGTILDDVWIGLAAMNALLERYNKPLLRDLDHYRAVFCFPVSEYYDKLGVGGELFAVTSHEWMDEYYAREEKCVLRAGAVEALKAFRAAGYRQVVLSASKRDNLLKQMARYEGVRAYFDDVLGLDHIYATSKVAIGQEWMQKSGAAPGDCIMIGDTLHDAQVASALGCRCVLAAGGHQDDQTLLSCGAAVARDVAHAAQLILSENV